MLTALVVTWPLVEHPATRLAQGTEPAATVPYFNLWTLRWNAERWAHGLHGYWEAPIFHPAPGAFAFSDPQPLTGLAFTPLLWLTHNPVLAANLLLVAILTLDGWAVARLARRLGVDPWPAVLAGVLAQCLPFLVDQLGVLQLTVLFPVVLAVTALYDWVDRGRIRDGVALGAWTSVTALTSGYYAIFLVVVLGVLAVAVVRLRHLDPDRLLGLLAGSAIVAVTALPVVLTQQQLTEQFAWSTPTVDANSAHPGDYARIDDGALGATLPWTARYGDGADGERLYPGTVVLALAAVGLVAGAARARRWRVALIATAAVLAALSLGLHLHVGGWQTYATLRDSVPGFDRLRSPFRAGGIAHLLLVVLAALGLDRLWRWRGRLGPALAMIAVGVALIEVLVIPQALTPPVPGPADWAAWLDDHDPGAAAVTVPFPEGPDVAAFQPTTVAMLEAVDRHVPLVAGYSGFFPHEFDGLAAAMLTFPGDRSLTALNALGVRWAVIDHVWLTAEHRHTLQRTGATLRFVGDGRSVYQLRTSDEAPET